MWSELWRKLWFSVSFGFIKQHENDIYSIHTYMLIPACKAFPAKQAEEDQKQ